MGEGLTPLSDLIARCIEQHDAANFERFLEVFARSRLGVIVSGVTGAKPGVPYVAQGGRVSCATVSLPDGKRMVLACADRPAFVRRVDRRFNAEVDARTLVTIAMANEACHGILLNSGLSEQSIALERTLLPRLLERCKAAAPSPGV